MARYSYTRRGARHPARRVILLTALVAVSALAIFKLVFHKPQAAVDADPVNAFAFKVEPSDSLSAAPPPTNTRQIDPPALPDQPPPETEKAETPEESPAPRQSRQARMLLDQGMAALAGQDFLKARDSLSRAVEIGLTPQQESQARQALNEAADAWLFSRNIFDGEHLCHLYKVVPGDSLARIGKAFAVPYQLLMRINNIERPEQLAAGETIKVVKGPFNAVVDRRRFLMSVYLGNVMVRSYSVGLGAPGRQTPTGLWRVKIKQPNPAWTDPETAKSYLPNDPDNPLGEHWIGLEGLQGNATDRTGFGIHGTTKPEEIGRATSRGCIRLHNGQVAELYDLLTVGASHVRVVD